MNNKELSKALLQLKDFRDLVPKLGHPEWEEPEPQVVDIGELMDLVKSLSVRLATVESELFKLKNKGDAC